MVEKTFAEQLRVTLVMCTLALVAACGGAGGGGPGSGGETAPSALSYASPQAYLVGTAIATLTPTVTGNVSAYSVSPALPAGMVLNTVNGQISGAPTAAAVAALYRVTAQNSAGSTGFDLSIAVTAPVLFWLEPTSSTLIGAGQSIDVFAALKASGADPYPAYVDSTQVSWTSSNPGVAAVSASGVVTGSSPGSTVITARYQANASQLTVQVSGNWLTHTIAVTGQGLRRYAVYAPDFGGTSTPRPAIVSLHGGGGSALIQAASTQLAKLAQLQQVYVVFLEGSGLIQTYNAGACCGYAQTNNVDDVQYVGRVLDDLAGRYNVDTAKTYASGFSNGGMMTHRLGCAMADRFAGIAAVGGGSAQFDNNRTQYYACNPARPIPVLHIHATNDRNFPFAGGHGDGLSGTDYYPIDATISDWLARNNVTNQATIERPTATTTCSRYSVPADPGRPSARVTLCKIDPVDVFDPVREIVFGGGHSWPGGVRSPSPKSDVPVVDFDASAYLWAFFNS